VLLPSRPQWNSLVDQRRNVTYEQFATQRGVTRRAYRAAIENRLEAWVAEKEIRTRVRIEVLPLVLADGRLKTQFETGTSGGAYSPPHRLQTEEALFGIPVTAGADERPIYGYLEGSNPAALVQYGPVVIRLRSDVRERTTFTMADSLDHTGAGTHTYLGPSPLSAPRVDALHTEYDLLSAPSMAHATGYGYVECQIHGGVTLADIAGIAFTQGVVPDEEVERRLVDADLEWVTGEGDEP
jgi:hypothetical protein